MEQAIAKQYRKGNASTALPSSLSWRGISLTCQ